MIIWSVNQVYTDKCTYHYDVPERHFLSKQKAEELLEKLEAEAEYDEEYILVEIHVME
jgi:DNA-directed RNA polymerase subunit H (RpoH/RPB5)